jgi:branched-chain amino acid transport system permease protein
MSGMRKDLLGTGLFLALLLILPHLVPSGYYVNVLIICALNAIVAVGLNLLLGYAGQISLGHAAFYGLAAYATAILTATFGWPMLLANLTAILLVAVVALLIGIPALKLSGHYLAMATLGFGLIVFILFNETVSLTGGPSGFVGIPRFSFLGYTFRSDASYYYLVAGTLTVIVLLSLNLIRSKLGRALQAIHTSEKAAQVFGIDIARYKLFIFVLSAVFAAIAGVLYAHYLRFVAPSSFGFHYSVLLITMVVLGGMANVWGSVAGAFFLTILPEFLRAFHNVDILIYGAILVLVMMFLPEGIAGGLNKLVHRLRRHGGGP